MTNATELYGESYEHDPVTPDAVAAAMAATEPGKRRLYDALSSWALVIITVLLAVFAGDSIYTTIAVHNQGQRVNQQGTCINTLVSTYVASRADATRHQMTKGELASLLQSCPGLHITVVVKP